MTWIRTKASNFRRWRSLLRTLAEIPRYRTWCEDGETSWWLQTSFHLPFMYTIGAEPAFDEHTVLVFPMLDPTQVKDLRAWVNGEPLDVRRYAYPRNRALYTWWADLVGTAARGGDNTLVVHVDFVKQ